MNELLFIEHHDDAEYSDVAHCDGCDLFEYSDVPHCDNCEG